MWLSVFGGRRDGGGRNEKGDNVIGTHEVHVRTVCWAYVLHSMLYPAIREHILYFMNRTGLTIGYVCTLHHSYHDHSCAHVRAEKREKWDSHNKFKVAPATQSRALSIIYGRAVGVTNGGIATTDKVVRSATLSWTIYKRYIIQNQRNLTCARNAVNTCLYMCHGTSIL
jgi:hypothetical protein